MNRMNYDSKNQTNIILHLSPILNINNNNGCTAVMLPVASFHLCAINDNDDIFRYQQNQAKKENTNCFTINVFFGNLKINQLFIYDNQCNITNLNLFAKQSQNICC